MPELGTRWRWESALGFLTGPWRESRFEAAMDSDGRIGYIRAETETAEVDAKRHQKESYIHRAELNEFNKEVDKAKEESRKEEIF